jgi:hypothetical protein
MVVIPHIETYGSLFAMDFPFVSPKKKKKQTNKAYGKKRGAIGNMLRTQLELDGNTLGTK